MPLSKEQLFSALASTFSSTTIASRSSAIANIIWQYTLNITPPSTAPATSLEFLITQFNAYEGKEHSLADALTAALPIYAQQLALGMQPAFTGVVPTQPLPDFRAIMQSNTDSKDPATACADKLSTEIHAWLANGTAVNNSSGVVIPWGTPDGSATGYTESFRMTSENIAPLWLPEDGVIIPDERDRAIQTLTELAQNEFTADAEEFIERRRAELEDQQRFSAAAKAITQKDIRDILINTPAKYRTTVGDEIVLDASKDVGMKEGGPNWGGIPPGRTRPGRPYAQVLGDGRIEEMMLTTGLNTVSKFNSSGDGYYWCAGAVTSWWKACECPVPAGPAACKNWPAWGRSRGQFSTTMPMVGSAVVYGDTADTASHIGIVAGVVETAGVIKSIYTIEGNTSSGYDRNGLYCWFKVGSRNRMKGFIHPKK